MAVSVYSVNITSLFSGTQCYIVLTDLKLPQFLLDVECACIILFHRTFSKEQYFDSNGLFFSTVYSTPVLFNCLLLLVSTQIFPVALSRKKKEIPICCKTVLLTSQQFIDLLPAIELLTHGLIFMGSISHVILMSQCWGFVYILGLDGLGYWKHLIYMSVERVNFFFEKNEGV